ncbi:MAG: phosphate ABC transporter permease PstA [Halobacteria archaeon]
MSRDNQGSSRGGVREDAGPPETGSEGGFGRVSRTKDYVFENILRFASFVGVVALFILLIYVAIDSVGWLNIQFLTNPPSIIPEDAGIYPALIGSFMLMIVVVVVSFPIGVGAAVYLEEYAPDNRWIRVIQINISNLAGVPSVVYGILGLGVIVNVFGFGYGTVLTGGVTLSLLILPIVIISSREAIRSVPENYREASYGMGATRWQTVRNVVLPEALPGILTGTILSIGRALGETAPLIVIGAPTTMFRAPAGFTDKVTAMPMQIFAWSDSAQPEFQHGVLAAAVVTLLVVLLLINSVAIYVRDRYERKGG